MTKGILTHALELAFRTITPMTIIVKEEKPQRFELRQMDVTIIFNTYEDAIRFEQELNMMSSAAIIRDGFALS